MSFSSRRDEARAGNRDRRSNPVPVNHTKGHQHRSTEMTQCRIDSNVASFFSVQSVSFAARRLRILVD